MDANANAGGSLYAYFLIIIFLVSAGGGVGC
jgi:hypothetical protein